MTGIADLEVPPSPNGKEVLAPPSRTAWRSWLATNHSRKEGLWIVYRKQSSALQGPVYDDLVEEALCFGWIDSRLRRIDDDRLIQWFSPRRRGGIWSGRNKERIAQLTDQGLMAEPGWVAIEQAKSDGSWAMSDDIEALRVPPDLAAALDATPEAQARFAALSDSAKRQHLWSIHFAKRAKTRADRITQIIASLAAEDPPR